MIEVIKHGYLMQEREVKQFNCNTCGCEFISTEYLAKWYDGGYITMGFNAPSRIKHRKKIGYFTAQCPECHNWCQLKPTEKEAEWVEY